MVHKATFLLFVVLIAFSSAGTDVNFRGAEAVDKLQVDPSSGKFTFQGKSVFLSGVNQAWLNYAYDFGNNKGAETLPQLREYLEAVHKSGGNTVRIWVHISGQQSPQFDQTGTDAAGTLVSDLRAYLHAARELNIFVVFCLWNGAIMEPAVEGLVYDESKLQSYIDTVLTPMVRELSDEPSLAAWEIMNEPEGSVKPSEKNNDPCLASDTVQSGAGWSKANLPYPLLLKFVNWQASAVRNAGRGTMVTVGTWAMSALTDKFGFTNHYSDKCLVAAGGKSDGTLDFYEGKYQSFEPFLHHKNDFALDKPLVIGEFCAKTGAGRTTEDQYRFAHSSGYAGAWGWQANRADTSDTSDGIEVLSHGMTSLVGEADVVVDMS